MSHDPFGLPVELPSFVDPDSYRRNVVPGPVPSPTLVTETVHGADLAIGDVVLFIGSLWRVSSHGTLVHGVEGQQTGSIGYKPENQDEYKFERVTHVTFGLLDSKIPLSELRDDTVRYYGKFSDQVSEIVYEWSMDGGNETCGHCDEVGWHATLLKFHTVSPYGGEWGNDPTLAQWQGELPVNTYEGSPDGLPYLVDSREKMSNPAGAIVHEDDRGFVSVWFYRSLADVDQAWSELQKMERDAYGQEDEDEESYADDGACLLHGIIDCTAPECIGTLSSEVRQTSVWGGTE